MKSLLKKIVILLFVSAAITLLANTLLPHRIPWIEDWSNHIESKAAQKKIDVIPLRTAIDFYQIKSHRFIDARAAEEYANGHIPRALSLPFQTLDHHFEKVEKLFDSEMPLIIYCSNRDCDDALLLAIELQNMGITQLSLYIDGFERWKEYGGSVEKTK